MLICLDQRTAGGCGALNLDGAAHCIQCGMPLRFALLLYGPGRLVGDYRIIRMLGHGMFGAVYEAEALRMGGLLVALKQTLDPGSISAFRGEFAALHQLQHPNLPRYYDLFECDDAAYLVMELVAGQSLEEVFDQQPGGLDEAEVLGYAIQLCDVLSYLHGQRPPLLHRDIKPANIRLTPAGLIKLVDFGLLKQGTQQTRKTLRGIGTPAYAPIEQYGGQHTDPQSDIYSLGATLYHLLTSHEPLPAPDRLAAAADPLPPPQHYNPQLSRRMANAVLRAMALGRSDRWEDAAAFKSALLGEQPPHCVLPASFAAPLVLQGHQRGVWSAIYSPDGNTIASASGDSTARLWRVADGQLLHALTGHSGEVLCIVWSPDGTCLASGGGDAMLRIWRAQDGHLLHTLHGHTGSILSVAWSPRGSTLASGDQDGFVRLWRAHDGSLLDTFHGHTNMILTLSYSPDGRTLSSASQDGTVCVWRLA